MRFIQVDGTTGAAEAVRESRTFPEQGGLLFIPCEDPEITDATHRYDLALRTLVPLQPIPYTAEGLRVNAVEGTTFHVAGQHGVSDHLELVVDEPGEYLVTMEHPLYLLTQVTLRAD